MPQIQIPRCYDSHLHFFDSGEAKTFLSLSEMRSAQDAFRLSPQPQNFRGSILVGFGWDSSNWAADQQPSRQILTEAFPQYPVYLTRADGHSCWINERAYYLLAQPIGLPKNESGVYSELEKERIAQMLPQPDAALMESFAELSQAEFLAKGFTHLRDVGSKMREWPVLLEMAKSDQLKVHLSLNYESFSLDDVDLHIRWIHEQKMASTKIPNRLRLRGIKIYYDGALGSETALLSKPYTSGKNGICLWDDDTLKKIMRKTWENQLELCVHTLGDEAVHRVLVVANGLLDEGISGVLNLEHVEVLAEKSRPLMKRVRPICHLQPCHFLYDQKWLRQKIADLALNCFPWSRLQEDEIEFYFGSDNPIMAPDMQQTALALEASERFGIPGIEDPNWWRRHSHPDSSWGAEFSLFDDTAWDLVNIKKTE